MDCDDSDDLKELKELKDVKELKELSAAAHKSIDMFFARTMVTLKQSVYDFCAGALAATEAEHRVVFMNAIQCLAHGAGPKVQPCVNDMLVALARQRTHSTPHSLEEDLAFLLLLEYSMACGPTGPALRSNPDIAQAVCGIVAARSYDFVTVCLALPSLIMMAKCVPLAEDIKACLLALDAEALCSHPEWGGTRGATVVIPPSPMFNDTWRLSQVCALEIALKRRVALETKLKALRST
jgi:hypothetical protein